MTAPSWNARDSRVSLLFAAAFVGSRLLWLALNPESSGYWEENYRWTAAHELLTGPVGPLFGYQADHYQGGSLVVILLTVPFFALFGESILTLKLGVLLISTGSLVLVYALARVWFGRTTGVLAASAYLVGPPLVAYMGLLTMGSHGDSTLFSLLQLFVFFGLLTGRWRRPVGWWLLGLLGGLGLWYCYTSGLGLAACAVTWAIAERRPPRAAELLWAVCGGILGLLPWLAYNLANDFVGVVRILEVFGYGNPIDAWVRQGPIEKLFSLVSRDVVGVIHPFRDALPGWAVSTLAVAAFGPLLVALAAAAIRVSGLTRGHWIVDADRDERFTEATFLVYAVLFLAVFLASRFNVELEEGPQAYRLFVPPAVLLLFPAAITAARALAAGGLARTVAIAGCVLVLTSFGVGTLAVAARTDDLPENLDLEGGYLTRGVLLHRKWEGDIDRALEEARRIPDPALRKRVFRGIGWGFEYRYEKIGIVHPILTTIEALPPSERAAVYSGMRWALKLRMNQMRALLAGPAATRRNFVRLKRLAAIEALLDAKCHQYPEPAHDGGHSSRGAAADPAVSGGAGQADPRDGSPATVQKP